MKAIRTSETSVYYNEPTRRNIPEGHRRLTRRRDNVKSHQCPLHFGHVLMYCASSSEL
jgi:hypothetical protein